MSGSEPPGYARHRPETTLLYRLIEQHYPDFRELRAREGRSLPAYVQEEFDAYLKCGRLDEGFLRVRCEHFLLATDPASLTLVLRTVWRAISGFLLQNRDGVRKERKFEPTFRNPGTVERLP